jgi:hypothetical protein
MMHWCDRNWYGKQYSRESDGNGRLLSGDCGAKMAAKRLYRTLQMEDISVSKSPIFETSLCETAVCKYGYINQQ